MIIDEDPCRSSPCQNGGTCISNEDKYDCECPESHYGGQCEGLFTSLILVTNNHILLQKRTLATLLLVRMEAHAQATKTSMIANVQILSMATTVKVCLVECWRLPEPDNTIPDEDPCTSLPCLNGGTCSSNEDQYDCQCPDTFYGDHCESMFG